MDTDLNIEYKGKDVIKDGKILDPKLYLEIIELFKKEIEYLSMLEKESDAQFERMKDFVDGLCRG